MLKMLLPAALLMIAIKEADHITNRNFVPSEPLLWLFPNLALWLPRVSFG